MISLCSILRYIRVLQRVIFFEAGRRNNRFINMIPFHPVSATFNITDNCNSKCITCGQWRQKSYDELTTDEVNGILIQLRDIGIRNVGFTGGEPLLRNDLEKIIKKSNDLGFDNIGMITNGLLLTKDRAKNLVENGLKAINISIDGTTNVHDYVRGINGSYGKCIQVLKMLVEMREREYPHLKIAIVTTLMKPTLDEIIKIATVAKEMKVEWSMNLIDFSPYFFKSVNASELIIHDYAKLNEVIDKLHKIKIENPGLISNLHIGLEYAKNYFKDPKREDIPCYLGYMKIYIGPHGEVYSGCWVLPPLGNLREKRLKDIINSNAYRKRLREMFVKRCPGCACGYETNLVYHFPSSCNEIWENIKNVTKNIKKQHIWKH